MLLTMFLILIFMPSVYAMEIAESDEPLNTEFVLRAGDCIRAAHCYLRESAETQEFDLPIATRPTDQTSFAQIAAATCSCLSNLDCSPKYLNFKALESYCFDTTPSLQCTDTYNPWNDVLPLATDSHTIDNQYITKLPNMTDQLVSIKSLLDLRKYPLLATSYWAIGQKFFGKEPSISIYDMVKAMELVIQKKEQKQKPKQSKKITSTKKITPTKKCKQKVTQTRFLGITKPRTQRANLNDYQVSDELWNQISLYFPQCKKPSAIDNTKTFLAKARYKFHTECDWKKILPLPFEKPEEIKDGPGVNNRWWRLTQRLGDSQKGFEKILLADLQ